MAQSTPSVVPVAAILISTFFYCSAENVYCITPTATSHSSCPHNSSLNATLSEYAQKPELYFTSNTTMMFLPGDHVLDTNITVANVARLTMWGEFSLDNIATVVRNGSVGISFIKMVNFNIYSLAFTSYNRSWSYGSHHASNSALLLQSTQNTKLVNCSFHDNIGTALTVNNTNIILEENEFIRNQCGCESFSEKCKLGCGITALKSKLTFTGNTTFLKNRHNNFGAEGAGAIWGAASSLNFTGTNNFFDNVNSATLANGRTAGRGGAIHITRNVLLTLHGRNNFINNSASFGGAIYTVSHENVTFKGNNRFSGNSAVYGGGAIYAKGKTSLTFIGTSNFSNNSAGYSGGAIYTAKKFVLIFNGVNNFINNSATNGGAIRTSNDVVLCISNTTNFTGNSANDGGAIYAFSGTALTFVGNSDFSNNSADYNGGAIRTSKNVVLNFNGTNIFNGNSAKSNGGAIFTTTNISLSFTGTSSFSNNSAMQGGAISANVNSTLTFDRNITFTNNGHNTNKIDFNNEVTQGGATYLDIRSTFSILPHTTVCWEDNHATLGGAIYVSDVNPLIYCTQVTAFIQREECFFQISGQLYEVKFVFKNNSADDAGSMLYGGAIDNCKLTRGLDLYSSGDSGDVFNRLVINDDLNTTSKISSDPLHICLCRNNIPDCSGLQCHHAVPSPVYPGETFQISVVAVGQRNGTVSSTVRSAVRSAVRTSKIFHPANLLDYQYLQQTNNTCTKLNYTVFSLSQEVNLTLHPEGSPCSKYNGGLLNISVDLNQTCPLGFNISESERSCVCEPRLADYTNSCNITDGVGQITRDSNKQFWVGYDHSSAGLILHPRCPFDFCVNGAVVFPLNNTDIQCAYNRSGFLCGRCKEGYSLVLGTHQCRKCTNSHLALLIPFALMGVALVFLLLVCKLTVAAGTLSGLVYYANIVGANRTIFLPAGSTNALSVFIAWLNLDFGIETCFYKGMDAYSKTWLQFVFSVYIWILVGLTIIISRYSQRFTKLLGSNPVAVLATLILLSYTKVLRTLISASSFADLDYPDNSIRRVWLHDANIDYLLGKHLPLFLMALFFLLFLFLPYTLLLLFGQWLQAISHLRLFSWVNSARLKHFMDSYHAPYKAKHRYWPGLLLVLRFVFTLVFTFHDTSFNLLVIVVGAGILHLWAWVSGGVYKNWCLDALEASFVLNLTILGAATYYVDQINGNKLAVGYTSVIIAFATFIGIIVYHIFQQLRHTKLWKKVAKLNMKLGFKKLNNKLNTKEAEDNLNNLTNDTPESGRFNQLREPLLDDPPQPTHSVV